MQMTFPSLEHSQFDTEANAAFKAGEATHEADHKKLLSVSELLAYAAGLNILETPEMEELRVNLFPGTDQAVQHQKIERYRNIAREQLLNLDEEFLVEAKIGLLVADTALFLQAGLSEEGLKSLDVALELAYQNSVREPSFAEIMDQLEFLLTRLERQFPSEE